jgi:FixJ family two-component response regulator
VISVAVVEDDDLILDATRLVLESHGWEAHTYPTGEAFLADIELGVTYDCLVLDPHLPGISGADVAAAISGSGIPILVLTARPDSPLTKAVVRLGARTVIIKPVDAVRLADTIVALLPGPVLEGPA